MIQDRGLTDRPIGDRERKHRHTYRQRDKNGLTQSGAAPSLSALECSLALSGAISADHL